MLCYMRNLPSGLVGKTGRFLFAFVFILTSHFAFSQKTVTGTVSAEGSAAPLSGATVAVKGTTVATSTNGNGAFSINVPAGSSVLVVSFVDYDTREVDVANTNQVNVSLALTNSTLNVVVVTGYSSQRKKDITGA